LCDRAEDAARFGVGVGRRWSNTGAAAVGHRDTRLGRVRRFGGGGAQIAAAAARNIVPSVL